MRSWGQTSGVACLPIFKATTLITQRTTMTSSCLCTSKTVTSLLQHTHQWHHYVRCTLAQGRRYWISHTLQWRTISTHTNGDLTVSWCYRIVTSLFLPHNIIIRLLLTPLLYTTVTVISLATTGDIKTMRPGQAISLIMHAQRCPCKVLTCMWSLHMRNCIVTK